MTLPLRIHWVGLVLSSSLIAGELQLTLPKENSRTNIVRDATVFLLEAICDEGQCEAGKGETDKDTLTVPEDSIPKPFLELLQKMKAPSAEGAYGLFKKKNVACQLASESYRDRSRSRFHKKYPIPDSLDELEKIYPFADSSTKWEKHVHDPSRVKGLKRVTYRSPDDKPSISVAQTYQDEEGDLPGEVRETEVIVRREGGTHWDYYVYGPDGKLGTESKFLTLDKTTTTDAPAPLACMACHYNKTTRSFTNDPAGF